ncbi:Nif3-like dinuclear metal center hexameric protein [Congregibacter variabilis]|uniref:Nif3-like dinuclear metal center hexameric protein n=1 Tax=Congregibacter variabilis TaxID=3081200 RepID=A0ABZ0I742_9GAMM|nr:Nif3-like dinuclear metal center hexameric protein [Congregibacter sp. IMCC43200]
MPVQLKNLVEHCDATLESARFKDYCPNGLQVEGRGNVRRLAAAVTANQSVLDAAVAWGADALLVHHGYFWRGESAEIVGMKRRRINTLLSADMSLLAYHLPLDAHSELGNNAQWGQRMGFQNFEALDLADPQAVGNTGVLVAATPLGEIAQQVRSLTGREPMLIGDSQMSVERVAWCTGAAQGYIEKAAAAGAQLYISGEISEPTVHAARELNIAYMAAGHHATERYGVQALAAAVAQTFDLDWTFIDCDNPV